MPRQGKAFNLYLTDDERAALVALADSNKRSVHDEIRHAIQRHLAVPPRVIVVIQAKPLPEEEAGPIPKGKPGRKPKPKE